jgi:hypothetical protein
VPDATKPAAAAAAQQLKQDIIRMSGSKFGHDLDAATLEAVQTKVKELEALQLPVKVEQGALTGSKWTTVFTTSDGEMPYMLLLQQPIRTACMRCAYVLVHYSRGWVRLGACMHMAATRLSQLLQLAAQYLFLGDAFGHALGCRLHTVHQLQKPAAAIYASASSHMHAV